MIDKTKVVKRLLKNRQRFRNNYRRLADGSYAFKLDPTCLCGLEVGDRFTGENFMLQVKPNGSEMYLILSQVQ